MRIRTYRNGRLVRDEVEGDVDSIASAARFIGITIATGGIIVFSLRIATLVSQISLG